MNADERNIRAGFEAELRNNCLWTRAYVAKRANYIGILLVKLKLKKLLMKAALLGVVAMMLFLTGCASVQPARTQAAEPTAKDGQARNETVKKLPPDLVFELMAAELAEKQGHLDQAAERYLAAAQISDDPKLARRAAELASQAGKTVQAQIAVGRWLKLAPKDVAALQARMHFSLELHQIDAAAEAMVRLVDLYPKRKAQAWRSIHKWLQAYRESDTTRAAVNEALKTTAQGADAEALLARSELAQFLGDQERALIEVSQASQAVRNKEVQKPELARRILRWNAALAVAKGDNQGAIDVLQLALSRDATDVPVRLQLADRIIADGDYAKAIEVLDQAPQANIQLLLARAVYGFRQHDEKGLQQSYERLRADTKADPSRRNLYLGNVAELMGDRALALDWYTRVDSPELSEKAGLRRAALMLEAGKMEAARAQAQPLSESADDAVAIQAYTLLSDIERKNDHPNAALEVLTRALAVLPDDPRLLYQRALLAESLDLVYMTEADLKRILAADPENVGALNALGYTLAEHSDRLDEAAELVAHALRLAPNDASIIDSMGWVLYRQGEFEQALVYLKRAMELAQNDEIVSHMVFTLQALGESQKADDMLDDALHKWPDSPALKRAGEGRDR